MCFEYTVNGWRSTQSTGKRTNKAVLFHCIITIAIDGIVLSRPTVVRHFQEYTEPHSLSGDGYATNGPALVTSRRHMNPLHPPALNLSVVPNGTVNSPVDLHQDNLTFPLPDGALEHNLGIPLIVVVTKVIVGCFVAEDECVIPFMMFPLFSLCSAAVGRLGEYSSVVMVTVSLRLSFYFDFGYRLFFGDGFDLSRFPIFAGSMTLFSFRPTRWIYWRRTTTCPRSTSMSSRCTYDDSVWRVSFPWLFCGLYWDMAPLIYISSIIMATLLVDAFRLVTYSQMTASDGVRACCIIFSSLPDTCCNLTISADQWLIPHSFCGVWRYM